MTPNGTCPDLPLDAFSKIVEGIYDCALDPSRWQETIGVIAELCRSHYGFLGVVDLEEARNELTFQVGYDDHYQRLYEDTYGEMNPFTRRLQRLPIGTVATRGMLVDNNEFLESRFYKEWIKPQHICDGIGFNVLKSKRRVALLADHRLESEGRYGYAEVHLLGRFAPHICRSVAISDALNLRTIRSKALEITLEALVFGVYLVDRKGRILFMNRAGDHQVRTSHALRIGNSHLAPIDPAAHAKLTDAIIQATADEAETPSEEIATLVLPGEENTGLVATILPLTRGERRNLSCTSGAAAVVFVQDPFTEARLSGQGFAQLYGLTASELRVMLVMLPGLSAHEAAETLEITEATVKTHLHHIYEKTGTSKQTELMHVFMGSVLPLQETQKLLPSSAKAEIASSGPNRLRRQDPGERLSSVALVTVSTLTEMIGEMQICLAPMGL
jgi:DNA-binding CsgD family transcriptional regulator